MRARGEGRGGLFLSRFYFSKWLTLPVLGHKKVLVLIEIIGKGYILGLTSEGLYVHTYIKKQSNQ